MKQVLLSFTLLIALSMEATTSAPFGAEILGAGSTLTATYMNALASAYNRSFPCPTLVYKQTPSKLYSGSTQGILRVLDNSVTFSVSIHPLSASIVNDAPDCLLQIPFVITSLSIIYRLPTDFTTPIVPAAWQGRLLLSTAHLCGIYAGTQTWVQVLTDAVNGQAGYAGATLVKAFAPADSTDETRLFINYLKCAIPNPVGICATFLNSYNVQNNPSGPFCTNPNLGQWGANVTCLQGGSKAIAQAVQATPGSIGYIGTDAAYAYGYLPGSPNGIPLGVAALYNGIGAPSSAANYTPPTTAAVQAAVQDCTPGELLCKTGAYPIVDIESFILYQAQPVDLITCNIAQFMLFALTEGQKIMSPGYLPLPTGCITSSLSQLDKLQSAICEPCIPPCNPCLNETCPLPCFSPCKQ